MPIVHKRTRTRDIAVRMGPGEYLDPHDLSGIIPWKRVLDIAAEEIPELLPSLLGVVDGGSTEAHVHTWLERWHLSADGYVGSIGARLAKDTLNHRERCKLEGTDPETAFYVHPLALRPLDGYETTWTLGDIVHKVKIDAYAQQVDTLITDDDTNSLLTWNPYHETRQEVTERLRRYLDMALDEMERPYGEMDTHKRTPELPRRHIVWFVRWKLCSESIYGIAKADGVTENAVRKAIDGVADILEWGHRSEKRR